MSSGFHEMMIKISSLFILFLLLLVSTGAIAGEQKIYPTVESFKSQLLIGVLEEKSLDINNDGKLSRYKGDEQIQGGRT